MTESSTEHLLAQMKKAPVSVVVKLHNELKQRIAAKKAELELALAPLQERQDMVLLVLLDHLNREGAQNIKTANGTVYAYTSKSYTIVDDEALWAWAKTNDASEIFQRRINVSAVEGFNESNPDNPVAGLHRESIKSARVRAK